MRDFQRLYRLTSSAEETIALARKGVRSAHQIARMDRKVFAEQNKRFFSAERADEVHEQALRTNAIALALLGEHGADLNRTGLHVLPKLDIQKQLMKPKLTGREWNPGLGNVVRYASTLAPARNAARRTARRPILSMFCSSSANAGRQGCAVRPPPGSGRHRAELRKHEYGLAAHRPGQRGPGECRRSATSFRAFDPRACARSRSRRRRSRPTALAAAFNPPLQPGARVETLEAGKRWRIWDEPFAYSVVKEDNDLKVVARSRQTTGSTEERRATPQYRNGAAYDELEPGRLSLESAFRPAHARRRMFSSRTSVFRAAT